MKKKDNLKILISYHKKSVKIQSEVMIPIQVGAKNSAVDLKMQRDDEGIHISDKNDKYCELTAQYWAWKNLDTEFYGFMHYRRQFVFKEVLYEFDDGRPLSYQCINKKYREIIGLEDEIIYKCVDGYDLILPLPVDTSSWGAVSNEVQFSCLENLHAVDFDMVCKTVTDLYPDYYEAVQEFRTGHYAFWYNMFIMRKELFFDYCEWLFRILEDAEKRIDFSKYNQQEIRTLAFMAERLLSIYLIKLKKDYPELKVKFLKMTFVHYTDVPCGDEEDIEVPLKKYSGVDYICSVERAYKELKEISLPYHMEEVFQVKDNKFEILFHKKRIIFYGGGDWCKQLLCYFDRLKIDFPIEIWDKETMKGQTINGIQMVKTDVELLPKRADALWVITIRNQSVSDKVKHLLDSYGAEDIIENRELVNWLAYKLWKNINCIA